MEDTFKDIYIKINYTTVQENVPEIEQAIRTIKERFRALYNQLPYNANPKVMIWYLVKDVVKQINMFPPKGGFSKTYSIR